MHLCGVPEPHHSMDVAWAPAMRRAWVGVFLLRNVTERACAGCSDGLLLRCKICAALAGCRCASLHLRVRACVRVCVCVCVCHAHGGRFWSGPDPKGGGVPPPSTDPKMVVQNNGFCGRPRRRRFCCRRTAGGIFFVRPYVSILKILRILWRIQKWLKSTKKGF